MVGVLDRVIGRYEVPLRRLYCKARTGGGGLRLAMERGKVRCRGDVS